MAGPNDNAILDLLALQGDPEAPSNLEATLAMLIRNNGGQMPKLADEFKGPVEQQGPPTPDPLAADENGHNLKKTGKVNTTGAMQRINAASPKWHPGVTATMQADGTLALSNTSAPSATKTASAMPTVGNDLLTAINSLKTTNDPDIARGLLGNIRESAAQKSSSLMGEAMRFAATKLGVPVLETQLREAEAADKADPKWYPGIGDSPITAKIRTALLTTRSSVDNEAKNYLSSNTTFASMNAALKTAEEEAKRIEKIGDRTNRIEDEAAFRSTLKELDKAEQNAEVAASMKATLSPEEQKRLVLLNPSIGQEATPEKQLLAMAASIKRADRDPAMREALGALEADLPILAMNGNPDAMVLTISKEANRPGFTGTEDSVKATLDTIAKVAGKPEMVDKLIRMKYGTKFDSPEAKAEKATMTSASLGLDAEGKKIKRKQDFAIALDLYRGEATDRFMKDTTSWGIQDPLFLAAQQKAKSVTGKADLQSVLTAYLQDAPAEGLLGRLNEIRTAALTAAAKNKGSLFGSPDSVIIEGTLARAAKQQGVWTKLMALNSRAMEGGVAALGLLVPDFSQPNALVDPSTGLLRQQ